MLYTRIRYALIFLFMGLGILLYLREGWYSAWYLFAAAFLLLLTHLFFGNVWGAFNLLKRGKPQEADRLLNQIWFPTLLLRRNRAYYYFSRGMIHLQKKELPAGEAQLLQASKIGLIRDLDNALLDLNLAHVYYLQQQYTLARKYLDAAKARKADDLLVRENVRKLEKALAALQ